MITTWTTSPNLAKSSFGLSPLGLHQRIWLNLLLDNHHLDYITKFGYIFFWLITTWTKSHALFVSLVKICQKEDFKIKFSKKQRGGGG
jgi:hypothetical protein